MFLYVCQGMICRRLPSNGRGRQLVVTVEEHGGWRRSRSTPVLRSCRNSGNGRPPSGSPVLSGVKLRETMCGEPGVGNNGPKSWPPPRYVAGLIFVGSPKKEFPP